MSETPSFSSFPPSFASFPDFGSESQASTEKDRKTGVKDGHRKRKRPLSSEGHEKRKAKKDHIEILDLPPSSYSDRKGDSLNIRYGGLHTRDVPKYHLVGRMSFLEFLGDV
jgi:hypothetical protein